MKKIVKYERKNLLLFFSSCLSSFFILEILLRLLFPDLGSDLFHPAKTLASESPFLYNDRIGYEVRPFTLIDSYDDRGAPTLERVNSEGFRGPEYKIPKPEGTYRILAIGDSVVQGFSVSLTHTWEQVLERELNQGAASKGANLRYQVINAGLGGYVSWQALIRLKDRGFKYQPDLVLVLVGWNDLVFSTLPSWKPDIDLSDIEQAYLKRPSEGERNKLWGQIRIPLYHYSYVARLIRQARNSVWNIRRIQRLIRQRQENSGLPFNEDALKLYVENLERIYQVTITNGVRMGLIIWPTILSPELLDDTDLHRRLVVIYSNFPLSTRELWVWYHRYVEAQRQFAARHPDIIVIDAAAAFADKGKEERLRLFPDLAHLTIEGNRMLAEVILQVLTQKGLVN